MEVSTRVPFTAFLGTKTLWSLAGHAITPSGDIDTVESSGPCNDSTANHDTLETKIEIWPDNFSAKLFRRNWKLSEFYNFFGIH